MIRNQRWPGWQLGGLFATLLAISVAAAQNTSLMIVVQPEAHLDPPLVNLAFVVDDQGQISAPAPVTVRSWVRALPGQQITLSATAANLVGPGGTIPAAALRWSGSALQSTWGGQSALCTNGSFTGSLTQPLIGNWLSSGTLTCSVAFTVDPSALSVQPVAGSYSAVVNLALSAQ